MLITVINGSLGGSNGNTSSFLEELQACLRAASNEPLALRRLDLANGFLLHDELQHLRASNAFVFASGTYWDSWGSPLQGFFELMTPYEATDVWLGKPMAALVTMHSVGGKEVLSRLQGVGVSLGLWVPPMSGLALSLATELAQGAPGGHGDDFWQRADLEIVAHNLLQAARGARQWRAWAVDKQDPFRRWSAAGA